ncbi:MAG: transcriptional repressor AgaR, partial [Porticoccaceae bacterium]|nr:transcriptional repressor AgaR [Porticoccaceae bacterium]
MRNTLERRQQIVLLTQEQGRVAVDELAERFGVSSVTIRSDLNHLDENGFVIRCHGGALVNSKLAKELSVQERYSEHSTEKRSLGRATAELINDDEFIFLDSGTTTEEVAQCLGEHKNLTVMTNGLNIANALSKFEQIEVIVTGGVLRKKSMSFFGRQAEQSLKHLHFDKVILGVDGFDSKVGVTTYFEPEATLNRLMCEAASEIIAVTDS